MMNASLARQAFVIFAEASLAIQPGEGPLHDPAFGQQPKARLVTKHLDDFQRPAQAVLYPVDQSATLAAVGPDQFQATPARILRVLDAHEQRVLDQAGPLAVLDTGCGQEDQQDQAQVDTAVLTETWPVVSDGRHNSNGDTSYAGLIQRGDELYVDYYTSDITRDWFWLMGMVSPSEIRMARVNLPALERLAEAEANGAH